MGLLGLATYLGRKMKQGYQDRKKERESLRARMIICDETAGYLLRSDREVSVRKERIRDDAPFLTKSRTASASLNSPGVERFRFSFNESTGSEAAPLSDPPHPLEEEKRAFHLK
jgi:hypothetical protein